MSPRGGMSQKAKFLGSGPNWKLEHDAVEAIDNQRVQEGESGFSETTKLFDICPDQTV